MTAQATGLKFAICQETFEGWDFNRVCSFSAELGYDGIELAPFMFADDVREISSTRRREIRAATEGHGLAITGLHWLLLKPDGLRLSDPDPSGRERARDYLKALSDFCADVGGTVMTLGSPKQRNIPLGYAHHDVWRWAIELLSSVGQHTTERGVTLCIEALPRPDTDFVTTASESVSLAQAVNSPGIAMMLDVKSMCSEAGRTPADIIRSCAGAFRHFHANDANRRGPGFGEVNFAPIFRALLEIEYRGFVSVEAFDFQPSPEHVARESLLYMRRCLAGLVQVSGSDCAKK